MEKRRIAALLGLWCALALSGAAAEQGTTEQVATEQGDDFSHLTWIITGKQYVDKAQAARIYASACQWIEDRYTDDRKTIRPHLTLHVGESCPNPGLGACISAASGALYIPTWDSTSPGAIAQATLITGLLELIDRPEMEQVTRSLLASDARDFVAARALMKTAAK